MLTIVYFAWVRERIGLDEEQVARPDAGTSIADLVLAIWIITLAYRLMKAGSGRVVVTKQRARRRRKTS